MSESNGAVVNTLILDGIAMAVHKPTPGEMLFVAERMREMAGKRCGDPVELAAKYAAKLPAVLAALLLSEALKVTLSGTRASEDAVVDEYMTLEGVRFRLWFHALRPQGGAQPADADQWVTPDNRLDVAMKLDKALQFEAIDPKDPPPPTGTPG